MPGMNACFQRMAAVTMLAALAFGNGFLFAADTDESLKQISPPRKAAVDSGKTKPGTAGPWKALPVVETPGWLPGSVVYSTDGKMLVVGGTGGRVVAFAPVSRIEKWKADVGGRFAAVAFAGDGKSVIATTKDGVRFLDVATGKLVNSIEDEADSHPTAVGGFPDKTVGDEDQKLVTHKIVFGNPRRYFVKLWFNSASVSTIETTTVADGDRPADPVAVPLAVDPAGSSVIITGPIHFDTGRNVLWAYVAGDHGEGSPGNRLLTGHDAPVASAAWSQDGKTAVSGDSAGRVIVWNAKTMKETRRFEFGERVAALALSADGTNVAAAIVGKQAEFHVWKTAVLNDKRDPLLVHASDFSGPIHACLAFSPDARQLVGCVINTEWPANLGKLDGKVHMWESDQPKSDEKPTR